MTWHDPSVGGNHWKRYRSTELGWSRVRMPSRPVYPQRLFLESTIYDDDLALTGMSAICFDAFGTLIECGSERFEPLSPTVKRHTRRASWMLAASNAQYERWLFTRELGLVSELTAMEQELSLRS